MTAYRKREAQGKTSSSRRKGRQTGEQARQAVDLQTAERPHGPHPVLHHSLGTSRIPLIVLLSLLSESDFPHTYVSVRFPT